MTVRAGDGKIRPAGRGMNHMTIILLRRGPLSELGVERRSSKIALACTGSRHAAGYCWLGLLFQ